MGGGDKRRGMESLKEQVVKSEKDSDREQRRRYLDFGSHCGASKKSGTREFPRNSQI